MRWTFQDIIGFPGLIEPPQKRHCDCGIHPKLKSRQGPLYDETLLWQGVRIR